jgi:hypothetical protein
MDCSQFKSNIFAFREGILSENLHHSVELHLSSCAACARMLSEYDSMEAIIAQEKATEPNPFAATRILQRIENEFEKPKNQMVPVFIRVIQPVAVALALLCGILIGSHTANREHPPVNQLLNTSENIEFLRSNLFISEFADEDKMLVFNK